MSKTLHDIKMKTLRQEMSRLLSDKLSLFKEEMKPFLEEISILKKEINRTTQGDTYYEKLFFTHRQSTRIDGNAVRIVKSYISGN